MERQGDEVHITTEEAKSGLRGNHVRNILLVSLVLVIAALSITWITGALNAPQDAKSDTVSNQAAPTPVTS